MRLLASLVLAYSPHWPQWPSGRGGEEAQGGGSLLCCLGFLGKALAQPPRRSTFRGKSQRGNTVLCRVISDESLCVWYNGKPTWRPGRVPGHGVASVSRAPAFRIRGEVGSSWGAGSPPPPPTSSWLLSLTGAWSEIRPSVPTWPPQHLSPRRVPRATNGTLCLHSLSLFHAPLLHGHHSLRDPWKTQARPSGGWVHTPQKRTPAPRSTADLLHLLQKSDRMLCSPPLCPCVCGTQSTWGTICRADSVVHSSRKPSHILTLLAAPHARASVTPRLSH